MSPEQAFAAHEHAPANKYIDKQKPVSASSSTHLTARECEVLRLLTMGLTNPQIAERLVISPVTVNTHVRAIYTKFEVTSRSAATRYALLHQLI